MQNMKNHVGILLNDSAGGKNEKLKEILFARVNICRVKGTVRAPDLSFYREKSSSPGLLDLFFITRLQHKNQDKP